MSRKENIEIVHRFYKTLNTFDLEGYFALLDPKIEYHMSGNTVFSGIWRGIDEVKRLLNEVFERFIPETCDFGRVYRIICADDNGAVAIMYGKGKTILDREYNQIYLHAFKILNGKITRFYDFYDTVMLESAIFGNDLQTPQKPATSRIDCLDEPEI